MCMEGTPFQHSHPTCVVQRRRGHCRITPLSHEIENTPPLSPLLSTYHEQCFMFSLNAHRQRTRIRMHGSCPISCDARIEVRQNHVLPAVGAAAAAAVERCPALTTSFSDWRALSSYSLFITSGGSSTSFSSCTQQIKASVRGGGDAVSPLLRHRVENACTYHAFYDTSSKCSTPLVIFFAPL